MPDAPVKNYLNIPAIIAIAKEVGVEYIHPGYGFLVGECGVCGGVRGGGDHFCGADAGDAAGFWG